MGLGDVVRLKHGSSTNPTCDLPTESSEREENESASLRGSKERSFALTAAAGAALLVIPRQSD